MAKLSGQILQKDGAYWVAVDMPSGEKPNIEHPSTFGYTEDVGPLATLEAAQKFLETGQLPKAFKPGGVMKQQVELNGETYIAESKNRQFVVSKKDGTPDFDDVILVLRALQEGKGKTIY